MITPLIHACCRFVVTMRKRSIYQSVSYKQIGHNLLHRESRPKHKAGILTSFHFKAPSRFHSGILLLSYKGTYSCGTVEDFHPVPFLIEFHRTLINRKDTYTLLKYKRKSVIFQKYLFV